MFAISTLLTKMFRPDKILVLFSIKHNILLCTLLGSPPLNAQIVTAQAVISWPIYTGSTGIFNI